MAALFVILMVALVTFFGVMYYLASCRAERNYDLYVDAVHEGREAARHLAEILVLDRTARTFIENADEAIDEIVENAYQTVRGEL